MSGPASLTQPSRKSPARSRSLWGEVQRAFAGFHEGKERGSGHMSNAGRKRLDVRGTSAPAEKRDCGPLSKGEIDAKFS